jgi:translation initiation factor IF-3
LAKTTWNLELETWNCQRRRHTIANGFRGRGNRNFQKEPPQRINERIRVPSVRVVAEDGEQLGVMDTRDAIQRARSQGLDLVEVSPNAQPPVCKIIDYGKFQYEAKKRANEQKKKQATVTVKEVKFRPSVDDHDYGYRVKHAREWLEDGDKVRAAIAFRGREMAHRELGAKILQRLIKDLADIADVEVIPKMEGYQMFTILTPKKQKPPVKTEKPKQEKPTESGEGKQES